MKFRTGLVVGLGIGYVLGAKAGRERYEQIVALSSKLRSNETIKKAANVAERSTRQPRRIAGDGLVKAADAVRVQAATKRVGTYGGHPDSK
ncbi:MAG: YtxH domain-containing protein [Acidimicrobiia bacterium]|nr:YtxH domain-containing protein [Acidimicrobiia bacterium]